jgi:hypothetical protein
MQATLGVAELNKTLLAIATLDTIAAADNLAFIVVPPTWINFKPNLSNRVPIKKGDLMGYAIQHATGTRSHSISTPGKHNLLVSLPKLNIKLIKYNLSPQEHHICRIIL